MADIATEGALNFKGVGDHTISHHSRTGDEDPHEHFRETGGGGSSGTYTRFYERGFYTMLGFVVALLVAWATHSVSKEDLAQAINTHANNTAIQVQGMKEAVSVVISNQQEMNSTMSALKTQVAVLSDKLQRGK